jgi:hypothetical protein
MCSLSSNEAQGAFLVSSETTVIRFYLVLWSLYAHCGFLTGLFFNPKDGGNMTLQNVGCELHDIISHKLDLFITTTIRTSNVTCGEHPLSSNMLHGEHCCGYCQTEWAITGCIMAARSLLISRDLLTTRLGLRPLALANLQNCTKLQYRFREHRRTVLMP